MLKLARAMVRRAPTGAAVAFSDGQGIYLVAMLLLAAAAVFLHRAMIPERKYHDALASLLATAQEAYRGETHQVLSAGLLFGSRWNPCSDGDLLKSLDGLATSFEGELRGAGPSPSPDGLDKCDDARMQRLRADDTCPTPTAGLGAAWTDDDPRSTLIVPSTVATTVKDSKDARSLLVASRKLADLEKIGKQFASQSSLRGMYFIDLLGALRYVGRWEKHSIIPAHRGFGGASYIYDALSHDKSLAERRCPTTTLTVTNPYLDLANRGVVHTLCRRMMSANDSRVLGTLCFDISPPWQTLRDALLAAADLFDLHLVRRTRNPDAFAPCEDLPGSCPAALRRLSSSELSMLEKDFREEPGSSAAAASAISLLKGGDYFGTTIFKDGEDAYVLFGRLARSTDAALGATVVMTLFIVLACGVVAVGVQRKARRLDVTLIRGLQVGVVEVDEGDKIIAANDRAEEIFGYHLPRFGDPRGVRDARLFRNQIEPEVVFLDDAGQLPNGAIQFNQYQEIKEQRSSGYTGSYYAFVRNTGRWIRVSGSTIVKPRKQHHTFGMLDTYVDEQHLARLMAARALRKESA